uniref:Hikeshi-like domain-containing protein n=1 Tax=Rhizochromulina marina TaxID=1034831 RepID=A0A7S2R3M5_9STRA|mmetsp:Transcript_1022/g.3323  ORF Transcript_1022/g.3323 Transcript_1022/m.3323 type:complete len:202 (+) Transcript_1022:190-795(+)
MAQPAAAAPEELLGVIVPGRPIQTAWKIVGESRAVLCEHILAADQCPEVMVSLLPGRSDFMRPDLAAVLYWSSDGAQWALLGALWNQKPSAMFRTGWSSALPPGSEVEIAVSLEPLEVAANLGLEVLAAGGAEEKRTFARAIARDLWNYLASFSQSVPGSVQTSGEMMLVPTTILDRWMERFDAKYQRDPNFMLKSSGADG